MVRGPHTFYSALVFAVIAVWCIFAALIVTLALVIWLFPPLAFGHDAEVSTCFNGGKKVEREGRRAHPSGLWAELYRGPKTVVLTLSPITGYRYNWNKNNEDDLTIEHSEHPVIFWVDWDSNGRFDESFVDKGGTGRCDEIEHYEYLNGGGELDEDNPRKETKWSLDSRG